MFHAILFGEQNMEYFFKFELLEQAGEDKKPTLDVLIRTLDRFNREFDRRNW